MRPSRTACLSVLAFLMLLSIVGAEPVSVAAQVTASGQVFVPVRINGSRTLWFLLDTASPTSADPSIIRELKLGGETGYRGRGTGPEAMELTRVPEVTLDVGSYRLRTPLFGTAVKQLEPNLRRGIDGILGAELFAVTPIEIDYGNSTVRIGARGRDGVRIPVVMKHDFAHVMATLEFGAGAVSGTFLVDTGANTTFDIYRAFADAHSIGAEGPGPPELSHGTGGESAMLKTTARSAVIGALHLGGLEVYLPQDTEGLFAVRDVAGLLGTRLLQRFNVTIDVPRKAIYLRRR